MNINLDIPIGEYRDFTARELNQINQSVEHSIKTFEAGKGQRLVNRSQYSVDRQEKYLSS